jgi:hypothetical protein
MEIEQGLRGRSRWSGLSDAGKAAKRPAKETERTGFNQGHGLRY